MFYLTQQFRMIAITFVASDAGSLEDMGVSVDDFNIFTLHFKSCWRKIERKL